MEKLRCTANVMRNAGKMGMPGRCYNDALPGCDYCRQHDPAVIREREQRTLARLEQRDRERRQRMMREDR